MDFAKSTGLSFASGINAYLPLLGLAVAFYFWPEVYPIDPQFMILTQPWCIGILAALTLADFFADKIPGVDHVWDAIHTVLRPVAGAMVSAAASPTATDGWMAVFLALGGALAGVTHITKAVTRATSTTTTGGCMNSIISVIEDVLVLLSVVISLLAPFIMLIVVAVFLVVFIRMAPRTVRMLKQRWPFKQAPPPSDYSGGGKPPDPGGGQFPGPGRY